ncbi:MAG: DUF2520 domain-containing protein [Thermotogae bacterium]|nr:DUF2520 domain-containing protein [Thermotogota bacterium]
MKVISVIGGGKVGRSLAKKLKAAGYSVGYVVCRTRRSAEEAVDFIEAGTPLEIGGLCDVQFEGYVVFSVPDDVLLELVRTIDASSFKGTNFVFHTSGFLSSKILRKFCPACAAIHPVRAFARPLEPYEMTSMLYDVEASDEGWHFAGELVKDLEGAMIKLRADDKRVFHLSCVISSNLGAYMMIKAREIMESIGVEKEIAEEALVKLMYSVLENFKSVGFEKALTGPAVRGDVHVVDEEGRILKRIDPGFYRVYKLIVEEIMRWKEKEVERK